MSCRSPEGDFANKRRRIAPSPSARNQHAARVQDGLQKAVFPFDVFSQIFRWVNCSTSPSPSPSPFRHNHPHIASLTLLCRGLRSEGERALYRSISLGAESESSQRCHMLLRTIQDRPDLTSYVKSLSFMAKEVDTRATVFLEITRRCKSVEMLHFVGTNAYDMSEMRCALAQVDPSGFIIRAGRSCLPFSLNNIQMVFAYIYGWKNIRQLDIGLGLLHLPAPGAGTSGPSHMTKPKFPIRYLGSQDADWTVHSLRYLRKEVDLPDLIQFQGGVHLNTGTLSALAGCLQLWSSMLTTLILELPKTFEGHSQWWNDEFCAELSESIGSLPRLRTLTASMKHIDSRRLLSCASLEDLCYNDTRMSDIAILGLGLREPTENGGRALPALRKLTTWWIRDFGDVGDVHDMLREELKARSVEYWWY